MADADPRLSKFFRSPKSEAESESELRSYNRHKELISTLTRKKGLYGNDLYDYNGFWYMERELLGILSLQKHFQASPTDIFLITFPKSGTTWIKALAFAVLAGRSVPRDQQHPLLTIHPQDCITYLDDAFNHPQVPDLSVLDGNPPRVFASHVPFSLLPDSAKNCKIVYVCRDPKDTLLSYWNFINKIRGPCLPFLELDKALDYFCDGPFTYGPIWDHQMEYRRESLKRPEMVLFLVYEEMKAKPEEAVRKLAWFLGKPFTEEEEKAGTVEEIVKLCSFEFMKELEVNKAGVYMQTDYYTIENSSFFRKGEVGDWKENLSPEMAEKIDQITQQKLSQYGLN